MKKLLDNNIAASVILILLSVLFVCFAVLYNDSIFSALLWLIAVFPIALTVCSYAIGYRFPTLFNGVTVAFGCLYSLLIATELVSLWMTISKVKWLLALKCISIFLPVLFVVTVIADIKSSSMNLRAVLSRLFLAVLTFPSIFCMILVLFHAIFTAT